MLAEIVWTQNTLGVVIGGAIAICMILGPLWYKATTATSENELKRSMVERGMSAEEIERVLAARTPRRKS